MSTLYLVATPIGNLKDITLRALQVLREVDAVFAEDTRRTRILLSHHGITARLRSLHAHNELGRMAEICTTLKEGREVALVADAGTPLISDPGHLLVARVVEEGYCVVPIPGPSAILSALVASGLPLTPFTFLGFLPRKQGARKKLLEGYRGRPETLVIFESPHRLVKTLRSLAEVLGNRRACVARELTKVHEELRRGSLEELCEFFQDEVRGEISLVVEGDRGVGGEPGTEEGAMSAEEIDAAIGSLLEEGCSCKDAAARLAPELGLTKRDIYARALKLKKGGA